MSGHPSRSPARSAAITFGVAFAVSFSATTAVMLAVGGLRSAGHPARLQDETLAFVYSPAGLMAGALVHSVVLLAIAFLQKPWANTRLEGLRLGPSHATPLVFAASAVGLLGVNLGCGTLRDLLGVSNGEVMDRLAQAFETPSAVRLVCGTVAIALVPALAEEIFFRGLIQGRLKLAWGRWPAIVITSAAFGLIHGDRVQGPVAFVAGLWLGWITERCGSVRPAVFAHAGNNALFLVLAALGGAPSAPSHRTWVLVGAVAACVGATLVLRRASPVHYAAPPTTRYNEGKAA